MRKLKLLIAAAALTLGWGSSAYADAIPTASSPVVGNTYYLYNPTTKLFMTTNVDLPFVRPTGSAWKLEAADGYEGWVKLRLKDNTTDGCGYFWGKWWANNPNQNSADYATETLYKLVNTTGDNYKLQSYAWGGTTAYIYINNGNEGDRSYRLACNSQEQSGLPEGYTEWQFISESDYAAYMADDYTSHISNNDFINGTTNWTLEGSGNKQTHGNTAIEYWNASAANGSFDYYQNLTNLPAGKYVLRAAMYNSTNGEAGASFDTAGQCGVYGTSNGVTKNANVTVDGTAYNIYTTDGLLVPDGNLRLGFKNTTTMTARWFGVDWIQLSCVEYCLSAVATALPANGAMEVDTWYYYELPTSDDYEFTSTDAATLTYTADGTQLISEATGTESAFTASETKTIPSLSAGRIYFKTNTATTLTVSYKYNVGEATANISYVQGGETVTVNFATSSNDPSASLTQDYSGVTFGGNTISVTPTTSGFTFTVPAVTANTEYTLAIPAGAIKYNDENKNSAQNITLTTPAIFDGTYFLKVAATYDGSSEGTSAAVGKYMARGTAYGTHLSLDSYGIPVAITTDGSNQTILKMADTNGYLFSTGQYDAYADGSDAQKTSFTISILNSKYLIASNNRSGKFLKYNTANAGDEEISVFDDGTGTNSGPIIMWAIETISEHATAMQAKKDNQAATAAAAAYASGNYESLNGITTVTALESELTKNYIEGAFVSPTTITSVKESYQPRNNSVGNLVPVTVYSNTINITEAGFYKFSMQAFNRATWNENVQAMHEIDADMPAAVLFFGDSETQIKSLYDEEGQTTATTTEGGTADVLYNGKYYANGTAAALVMFKDDKYHNDVWFYCSTPGTYTYGVKVMGYAGGQWFIYSPESVTITSYAAAADASDYTALENAISAYDAVTWGFEENEYAPYNNVSAIQNIAAAKAIDETATNSKLLVNSLTNDLALTANSAEVNAIYDGSFAETYSHSGNVQPTGWNGGTNHDNATDVRYMWDVQNNAGLAATTNSTAMLTKYDAYYGKTEGYTMPLKANTVYKLTFKYGTWGTKDDQTKGDAYVQMEDGNGNTITVYPSSLALTNDQRGANESTDKWYNFTGYFTTSAAGNYVLDLLKTTTSQQNQYVYGDLELKKAVAEDVTIAEDEGYTPAEKFANVTFNRTLVEGWNGLVLPFDATVDEVKTIFNASAVKDFTGITYTEGSGVTLDFTDATEVKAGRPFMVKANQGSSYTINGVILPATGLQSIEKAAEGNANITYTMTGTYAASTDLTNVTFALINGTKYYYHKDGDGASSAKAFRAYFVNNSTAAEGARVSFNFGDDMVTGINEVKAQAVDTDAIYNLGGQRVMKTQKGLYIQNGKKVVVK